MSRQDEISLSTPMPQVIEAWLKMLSAQRSASKHTIINYGHDAQVFVGFLGRYRGADIKLKDLEKLDITEARAWLGDLASRGVGRQVARGPSHLYGIFTVGLRNAG